MNTTFQVGDLVQAHTTAQGMARFARYVIIDVVEQNTGFGNFVTYVVKDDLDGSNLAIRNGHLLLSKVA